MVCRDGVRKCFVFVVVVENLVIAWNIIVDNFRIQIRVSVFFGVV